MEVVSLHGHFLGGTELIQDEESLKDSLLFHQGVKTHNLWKQTGTDHFRSILENCWHILNAKLSQLDTHSLRNSIL